MIAYKTVQANLRKNITKEKNEIGEKKCNKVLRLKNKYRKLKTD